VPLAGWVADAMVARTGSAVISNFDIARFLLSPVGFAFALLALLVAIGFLMAQFSGYSWIAGHAILGRPLTLRQTLGAVAARLPTLVELGLRVFLRTLLLALPFVAVVAIVWFTTLRGHDINYYLAERPPEWRRLLLVAALAAVGFLVALIAQFSRWLYMMPIAMFRELDARATLEESECMLKGRVWRSIRPLIAWWVLLTVAVVLCAYAGRLFSDAAFAWAGINVYRVLPLVALCLGVSLAFGFVYATLQYAGHQFLITRQYAEQRAGTLAIELRAVELPSAWRRIGRVAAAGVLAVVGLVLAVGALLVAKLKLNEDVSITAHRGASLHAPENTLAAFRAAHEGGAQYVELDVQRTRDGAIVVIHDGDLMRMAGDPRKVAELSLAEIGALDVGAKRSAEFTGERVPTLEQVIDYARGRLHLNVELKYNVPDPGLAPAVVELLRRERFLDQVVITSLDHAALRQVERLEPSLPTGLIVTAAVGDVARTDTDFVSLNSARVNADLVDRARAAGKQVHVWTVNKPEVMLRMIEREVDNIITDDPGLLSRVMRDRNRLSKPEKLGLQLRVLFTRTPRELTDAKAVPEL
jgi:glycerophosphoryl diester phosphodiesterase